MLIQLPSQQVAGLLARAVLNTREGINLPVRRDTGAYEWQASGRCQSPVLVSLWGRPFGDRPSANWARVGGVLMKTDKTVTVDMHVRCRECEACLKRRAAMWRERAINECQAATMAGTRTWFATCTFNFEQMTRIIAGAIWKHETRERGLEDDGTIRSVVATTDYASWEALSEREQFRAIQQFGYAEIQKWLKRVRKGGWHDPKEDDAWEIRRNWQVACARAEELKLPPPPKPHWDETAFRYLVVTEAHEGGGDHDGLPHFHLLIHEQPGSPPLTERRLRHYWRGFGLGFFEASLVREDGSYSVRGRKKSAGYLCKYLSKSVLARVRASGDYGRHDLTALAYSASQMQRETLPGGSGGLSAIPPKQGECEGAAKQAPSSRYPSPLRGRDAKKKSERRGSLFVGLISSERSPPKGSQADGASSA